MHIERWRERYAIGRPIMSNNRRFDDNAGFAPPRPRQLTEFNAMALSTAWIDGKPPRMVLLRGHDEDGFCFYTNYLSRKGSELAVNPFASLLFFWRHSHRQIRIEGTIRLATRRNRTRTFASRPKGHASGGASPHKASGSRVAISSGSGCTNCERYQDTEACPSRSLGRLRFTPLEIEFGRDRENRLHDRVPSRSWAKLA